MSLDDFYFAINEVKVSTDRKTADELTFAQHVMMRHEFAKRVANGTDEPARLVAHWPRIWHGMLARALGPDYQNVLPSSAREREQLAFEEVHWQMGMGGPATYVGYLYGGQLMAAQILESARRAIDAKASRPEDTLDGRIARGDLKTLTRWLSDAIYRHGKTEAPHAMLERVTGNKQVDAEPWLRYVENKYSALYGLHRKGAAK